jgi:hypothetical protein
MEYDSEKAINSPMCTEIETDDFALVFLVIEINACIALESNVTIKQLRYRTHFRQPDI